MMNNKQPPLFRSRPQQPLFRPPQKLNEDVPPSEHEYDPDIHHRILAELKIMNDKLSELIQLIRGLK